MSEDERVRVVVRIEGVPAEALLSAIRPDDATAPGWLRIREECEGDTLIVEVVAPLSRLGSVRSTVDEILEFLYAALRSIEEALRSGEGAPKSGG